jgi:hypothetical protein
MLTLPVLMTRPLRSRLAPSLVAALIISSVIGDGTSVAVGSRPGWTVRCAFVRYRSVDPIVYPGERGMSHLHAFYGNKNVGADSTYRSLRRAPTSCRLRADRAAYWIPAAYVGGVRVTPKVSFYYRSRTYPLTAVRPFPRGLKIIAGDSKATSAQRTGIVYWDCDNGGPDAHVDHPVDCGPGTVSAHVIFPDCWDGRRLDSSDHRSHMDYAKDPNDDGRFVCPARHPVPVPRLFFSISYPIHDGTKLTLASGSALTMHADFINSWVQRKLRALVRRCIHRGVDCGAVSS